MIVPTFGRPELIHGLLDRLAEQTLDPSRFEVVAVDDGSPEPIRVDEARHRFALRLLRQANSGPGGARNLAIEHCRAPLVLILNDDAVPAPDLLEKHLAIHAEATGKVAVLGTFRFAPDCLARPFVRLLDESNLLFDFPGLRHGELHDWRFFWTCNLSLPTAALREVGGFDAERFREAIVEDVELGYRLEKRGWRVLYREDAVCHHAHELTPRSYFARTVRLGVNLLRMWRKHADPRVIWMQGNDAEAFFQALQLHFETHREASERLLKGLERMDEGFRDRPLPADLAESSLALVRKLSLVSYGRGILMELTGRDPEPLVEAAPRSGQLTSVVVVSHDALDQTRRCLEALRASREAAHPIEIIFVDNGSRDGTAEYLAEQPDVRLVANAENLGAPCARNRAIPLARGDWVAFLDNDALVTPGWLGRMLYHGEADPLVGCVCPVSDRAAHGQQIRYAGTSDPDALRAFADQRAGAWRRRARYGCLFTSFCVLVRRDVVETIGGFDERFSPWGFEDDDFSLRAHLAGFRSRVALDVFVRHEAYAGVKKTRHEGLLERNWKRFASKWAGAVPTPEYGDYSLLAPVLARSWSEEELYVHPNMAQPGR